MTSIAEPNTEPLWTRARAMFARAVAAVGDAAAIAVMTSLPRVLRRQIVGWLCPLEHIVRKLLLAEAAELHRAECARIARAPRIERVPLRGMAHHVQRGSARPPAAHCAPALEARPEAARSILDKAQPNTWRASFSFALPRNPHVVPNARAPRILNLWGEYPQLKKSDTHAPNAAPELTTSLEVRVCHSYSEDAPYRLARRFEALRRVLENPRPHAERLARVLAREARRVPQLVTRYVWASARTNDFDPADPRLSLEALGAAWHAPDAFKDTS
jgi:hypothetical protein